MMLPGYIQGRHGGMIRRSEKFWSIPSRCTGLEQLDKESEGEAG